MAKLSDDERALLEELNQDGGTWQINTWALKAGSPFSRANDLGRLQRRGLVAGEGRGNGRQWWITDDGKAALAAVAA